MKNVINKFQKIIKINMTKINYYSKVYEELIFEDIKINRDKFGNFLPEWKNIQKNLFLPKIKKLVSNLKDNNKGKAFIVKLNVEDFDYSKQLLEAGIFIF
jgi:hypothetical protein